FLFSLIQSPAFAQKKSYVVYMGGHSRSASAGLTQVDIDRRTNSHYNLLSTTLGSTVKAEESMFYSYTRAINGFAANLDENEAAALAQDPNVVSVFENRWRKLHTTRAWNFMELENDAGITDESLWKKANYGDGIIIGNFDTGVWPESESFKDDGYGPIPEKWKGLCPNDTTEAPVHCNRKLIGARYFRKGYEALVGASNITYANSARDTAGHGSHTLATAGGEFVKSASVYGMGIGTAKGGAPKSRVAAYKVCWAPVDGMQCTDADILAGFESAITDGVDILTASLGGSPIDYFQDGISIGAFHANKWGIMVVVSAGNSGPVAGTVSNVSPWLLTVGANTMDRDFSTILALGNRKHIRGQSLRAQALPEEKFYALISAADANLANITSSESLLCQPGTLDPVKVKDKILVCLRGITGRVDKGKEALKAGAVGMVLANDEIAANDLNADYHALPTAHIIYSDGLAVFSYLNSTKTPGAFLTRAKTELGVKPAPVMAAFSSQGPNTITPDILKPDITAPGVNIIAAYTQAVNNDEGDTVSLPFNALSGTSMSCPTIAGIAALVKAVHLDWSPSAIKSAIMTTARTLDNEGKEMRNASTIEATPFSYGAGHVNPNLAVDPGLVYDLTTTDYLNFLCAIGYTATQMKSFSGGTYTCTNSTSLLDFNYPSITVPNLSGSATLTRTVKNVGTPGTYHPLIKAPAGISVSVEPKTLTFATLGEEKKYSVTLTVTEPSVAKDYVFGSLSWTDSKHVVRSPLVVKTLQK
ncbi:hypothetical protein GIB67_001100, partial [Kingdonia uniflora]